MSVNDPDELTPGGSLDRRGASDSGTSSADPVVGGGSGESYVQYRGRIHKFVRDSLSRSGCSSPVEHSEDVTQEVFTRAHRFYHRLDPEKGTILNWLYGIARNELYDHLRSCRAREESLDALMASGEQEGRPPFAEPRAPLADYDNLIWLNDQLKRMPENIRRVFALRVGYGYDYGEIAKELGIGAAYAKKLCFKARLLLKTEER